MHTEIKKCRICGNANLVSVLHLGELFLSGVFPRSRHEKISAGPLELVKCEETNSNGCGLLQVRHTFAANEMYGENYGYRSGLNPSMIAHLKGKVQKILSRINLNPRDLIIDIGSNDSTLLQAYPPDGLTLLGIDPTGTKFKKYYPDHIRLIPDFFSAEAVKANVNDRKAKVITSIAMFYDLEDPLAFMRQIEETLTDDGLWVFEQSYMPTMLEKTAYDTICHEHIEYYRLKQIKWMADKVGLTLLDVEFNDTNGGSFSVTAAKHNSPYKPNSELINRMLRREEENGLGGLDPYRKFNRNVQTHKDHLNQYLAELRRDKKKVLGYGASTKGNIILQYCKLTEEHLSCIGEVNADKFGCFTPGSWIPIVPEAAAKAMQPDYLLVFPWHFKEFITTKEKDYLKTGGKLLFPLPTVHAVGQEQTSTFMQEQSSSTRQ